MVAVIHSSRSLRQAINYNENKVKMKAATFLQAGYYLKNPDQLTFHDKLNRLQKRIDLNGRVKVNTLHISLNFATEDKVSSEKLKQIAALYLDKIGFEKQPYLLYEHHDVAHQHVHIVTTNIRADGSSINLHNIGKIRSEAARKQIEIEFGLIKAQEHCRQVFELKPVQLTKASYGKSQTKQAISNVLTSVLKDYKYTSVPELNAVLAQYNIAADRGSEDSRIFKNQGLTYRILDEQGNRVGVPIKASDFHFKPTLTFLEQHFEVSKTEREKYKARLKNTIDFGLQNQRSTSLQSFVELLKSEGVAAVLRRSDAGALYGITYVDYRTKCVFNGSTLGKAYSAKAVQERCAGMAAGEGNLEKRPEISHQSSRGGEEKNEQIMPFLPKDIRTTIMGDNSMIDDLFKPEIDREPQPWQLRKRRRGRRRKGLSR